MKIIFLLPNLYAGGAERVVTVLAGEMVEMEYSVQILLLTDSICQYKVQENVELICLNTKEMSRTDRFKILRNHLKKELTNSRVVVIPFQRSCLKHALAASFGLEIPVIATERNDPNMYGSSFWHRVLASIPFILSKMCVFQTQDAANYYILPKHKKKIIANPITPTDFVWKGNLLDKRIIMACRLDPQKNITMMIDAIELLANAIPDIKVDIYGDGVQRTELEKICIDKSLSDKIKFCGKTQNVLEKMSESSIYVSTSDYEGISNSMLEAMSIGMPIICTDCPIGGARMMLSNGAGVLIPVGDAEQLSNEIKYLLSNMDYASELGHMANERTRQYTSRIIAKSWLDIIYKIVKEHR